MALWARGFDLAGGLPKPLYDRLMTGLKVPGLAPALDLASWIGAHIYEITADVHWDEDRTDIAGRVTTFGADPPEARRSYEAALTKRFADDAPGYIAALTEVQRRFPKSLAAKQAALVKGGVQIQSITSSAIAAAAIWELVQHIREPKPTPAVK
jgi:hypothetical protein